MGSTSATADLRPHGSRRRLGAHRQGNGRFTKADRRNFFGIARGSVREIVPPLELAQCSRSLPAEERVFRKDRLEEIARMLSRLTNGRGKRYG
jgi:four helix bundle protein